MVRKFSLMLVLFGLVTSLFSQEKIEKTYWYTSSDSKGYISIQKIDSLHKNGVSTTLKTQVKAIFQDEVLDFSLSTFNETDKMVAPVKMIFDGTIDSNIKPVHFTGKRIKRDKKKVSYWYFDGDFKDEMEKDPDFKRYTTAKHNSTLKIPNRTIPTFNLWAIIPDLPFDRKGTFRFNSLDETKLYVKKDQTVNYLGTTKIDINGKTLKTHKFVHQGKGTLPAYFWVSPERELVQVLLDGEFTFTISTKEAAMQTAMVAESKE